MAPILGHLVGLGSRLCWSRPQPWSAPEEPHLISPARKRWVGDPDEPTMPGSRLRAEPFHLERHQFLAHNCDRVCIRRDSFAIPAENSAGRPGQPGIIRGHEKTWSGQALRPGFSCGTFDPCNEQIAEVETRTALDRDHLEFRAVRRGFRAAVSVRHGHARGSIPRLRSGSLRFRSLCFRR